jgi:hypothetical protein
MNSEYEACKQWITAARETQRIVTQTTQNNRDDQREKVISSSLSTTIAGYSYERKRFNPQTRRGWKWQQETESLTAEPHMRKAGIGTNGWRKKRRPVLTTSQGTFG